MKPALGGWSSGPACREELEDGVQGQSSGLAALRGKPAGAARGQSSGTTLGDGA
jgi:hypothetical protein